MPAAAAKAAKQGVFGGLAIAKETRSPALGQQVRDAFDHGMRVSLAVSAGGAPGGGVLPPGLPPRGGGKGAPGARGPDAAPPPGREGNGHALRATPPARPGAGPRLA